MGLAVAPIDAFDLLLTLDVPVRIGGWYTGTAAVDPRELALLLSVTGVTPGEFTSTSSGVLLGFGSARTPMPACGEGAPGVDSGSGAAATSRAAQGVAAEGGLAARRLDCGRGGRFC